MATSWQLIRYDVEDISRILFRKTWLRYVSLLRARLKILSIEFRLNSGGEIKEHDPWLRPDNEALLCMTGDEAARYLDDLARIQDQVERRDPPLRLKCPP